METVAKISLEFNGKFLYTMPAKRSASLKNSFERSLGENPAGGKEVVVGTGAAYGFESGRIADARGEWQACVRLAAA